MSKKDDTIKALKKKLKKLKAEVATLKAGGKPAKKAKTVKKAKAAKPDKAKTAKAQTDKTKTNKAPKLGVTANDHAKVEGQAKAAAPTAKKEPMKIVSSEPSPPPARAVAG